MSITDKIQQYRKNNCREAIDMKRSKFEHELKMLGLHRDIIDDCLEEPESSWDILLEGFKNNGHV